MGEEVNIWIPVDELTNQVNDINGVVGFTHKYSCEAWVRGRNKLLEEQGGRSLCGFKAGKVKAVRMKITLPKDIKGWKHTPEMV